MHLTALFSLAELDAQIELLMVKATPASEREADHPELYKARAVHAGASEPCDGQVPGADRR